MGLNSLNLVRLPIDPGLYIARYKNLSAVVGIITLQKYSFIALYEFDQSGISARLALSCQCVPVIRSRRVFLLSLHRAESQQTGND